MTATAIRVERSATTRLPTLEVTINFQPIDGHDIEQLLLLMPDDPTLIGGLISGEIHRHLRAALHRHPEQTVIIADADGCVWCGPVTAATFTYHARQVA